MLSQPKIADFVKQLAEITYVRQAMSTHIQNPIYLLSLKAVICKQTSSKQGSHLIYVKQGHLWSGSLFYKYHTMILIPLMLMLGGYLIMSWVLFFFPTLLHKPHRYPKALIFMEALFGKRVLKIAHRGGPRKHTENTIESFQEAAKYSDMLEMDVCQTKDRVLVVHHDHDLERTCGLKAFVRDLNFKDLPPFKEKIELNFAPLGMTVTSKGQRIPTLQEIFTLFPGIPMNIELKTPSAAAVKEITKMIRSHQRQHITILGIRNQHQDTLRQVDRKIMTFMRDKEFFFYFIAMIFGLLPYIYIEEHTMQVPLWTKEAYQWKVREWGDNWKVHLFFKALKLLNSLMGLLSYHLRKRGIMTYFWVCNSQDDFQRALKYGACGIMTDDPPLLHEYLLKKNINPAEPSEVELKEKKDT